MNADRRHRLKRRVAEAPDIPCQVPRKAGEEDAARHFGKRPESRKHEKGDRSASTKIARRSCGKCREQGEEAGKAQHRRPGECPEPNRVDEKALGNPPQADQELADAKAPADQQGGTRPAAVTDEQSEGGKAD
ncbi:hypothetical protein HK436_03595 [Mesorhizobium sediminum]|nr:hypothetical protein [Mesorhizobium sediminum]